MIQIPIMRAALVALTIGVAVCGCKSPAPAHRPTADELRGLQLLEENLKASGANPLTDADIQTIIRDNVGPGGQADGLVVGICDEQGSRVISAGSAGKDGQPADGDTLFEIGSITKLFTALLLQDMVERGEMKLDDPVQTYLPPSVKMPSRNGKQVTLFDLATHTSGLPRDGGGDTVERLASFLSQCQLRHDPGTKKEYSNLGVGLLGYAIALKAGTDYESLVVERICRPLGMQSTRIALTPELKSRSAIGHAFPGRPVADSRSNGILLGAGAMRSTANDLLKLVSASLGLTPSPLTPLIQKSQSVQQLPSGRSGRLVWEEDAGALLHGGLVGGFRTNLGLDPAKRRGAVVLANCASSRIPVSMLGQLLQARSPRPQKIAPIDTAVLASYEGQYQFDGGAVIEVRCEGNRLLLQTWRGEPLYPMSFPCYEVFPQSETLFYNQIWDIRIAFVRSADGKTTTLLFTAPREGVKDGVGTRISPATADPPPPQPGAATYDGFVGQYRPALLGLIPFGPTLNLYRTSDAVGEHLHAYVEGLPGDPIREELYPFSETMLFHPELEDCSLSFERNAAGKLTKVVVRFNGTTMSGVRVSDRPKLPNQ